MRYFALTLAILSLPSLAQAACPPLPDRSPEQDVLKEQIARAPNEGQAQELNNKLWAIWTTAPDTVAQEMLDRGMQKRRVFDFLGAIKDFDALIDYCPHYAEGYNQRAFIHFLREDYDDALDDLRRTLEITPDHIGAASGVALSLLRMGRHHEGQIALRAALALNPWLPERFELKPLDGEQTDDTVQEL